MIKYFVIRNLWVHAHLLKCSRGTWLEKGWEPLIYNNEKLRARFSHQALEIGMDGPTGANETKHQVQRYKHTGFSIVEAAAPESLAFESDVIIGNDWSGDWGPCN